MLNDSGNDMGAVSTVTLKLEKCDDEICQKVPHHVIEGHGGSVLVTIDCSSDNDLAQTNLGKEKEMAMPQKFIEVGGKEFMCVAGLILIGFGAVAVVFLVEGKGWQTIGATAVLLMMSALLMRFWHNVKVGFFGPPIWYMWFGFYVGMVIILLVSSLQWFGDSFSNMVIKRHVANVAMYNETKAAECGAGFATVLPKCTDPDLVSPGANYLTRQGFLYAHIICGCITILSGGVLFWPNFHKRKCWYDVCLTLYGVSGLGMTIFAFPLAISTTTGIFAAFGFTLVCVMWPTCFMLSLYYRIVKDDHKKYMEWSKRHYFGILCKSLLLRYTVGMLNAFVGPEKQFVSWNIAPWLAFFVCIILVELHIHRERKK